MFKKSVLIIPILILLFISQLPAQNLSGSLSGTYGPGDYLVVGTIYVQYGNTLTLMPGTTFRFNGNFDFPVYGEIIAVGTETDSIYFVRNGTAAKWNGIDLQITASDESRFEYCYVTGSDGGAIYCYNVSPTILHCTLYDNSAGVG